jgi:hypothetical protein
MEGFSPPPGRLSFPIAEPVRNTSYNQIGSFESNPIFNFTGRYHPPLRVESGANRESRRKLILAPAIFNRMHVPSTARSTPAMTLRPGSQTDSHDQPTECHFSAPPTRREAKPPVNNALSAPPMPCSPKASGNSPYLNPDLMVARAKKTARPVRSTDPVFPA